MQEVIKTPEKRFYSKLIGAITNAQKEILLSSSDELSRNFSLEDIKLVIPDFHSGKIKEENLRFKYDSLGLDVIPELSILTSIIENYSSEPWTLLSEELGKVSNNDIKIEHEKHLFIADPLDQSKTFQYIISNVAGNSVSEKIDNYSKEYSNSNICSPSINITHFEEGRFNAGYSLLLSTGKTHAITKEGIFEIGKDGEVIKKLNIVSFNDCDKKSFVTHIEIGNNYEKNLLKLNIPGTIESAHIIGDIGPTRQLLFTKESIYNPRFIVFNGEKIAEWVNSLPLAHYKDFNVYYFEEENSLEMKGGDMMPKDGIIKPDGIDFSKLNIDNPSTYRSTIAVVYKEDNEMNEHFQKVGGKKLIFIR